MEFIKFYLAIMKAIEDKENVKITTEFKEIKKGRWAHMSKRERQAYRKGQVDMLKMIFGCAVIAATFATMFGQAFLF